jgi:citronellol/citronellal dehydrogenase
VSSVLAPGCLAGRTALVTGGGTGIGRATAHELVRLGARVAICGRREEKLAATVGSAPPGESILAVPCDVRETAQVDALLDAVLAEFGSIDLLVNNAGGQFVAAAENISYNGFRAVTRLNLDATWYVTVQVANRSMLPRGYGKVVSITMTPRNGAPGMSHSFAARAGVESLTKTLGCEWAGRGIRLVAIAPGIVRTEGWEQYGITEEEMSAQLPLGRMQTPGELAELIAFCLSPAGDYITGSVIVADGGVEFARGTVRLP